MKRTFPLLILCLSLLLAGCGVPNQDVMDSIPTLTLETGSSSTPIPSFSYDWTLSDQWGSGTSVIADTAHPLDAQKDLTTVPLSSGAEVSLTFSKIPDSVTVTFWSADETDYDNSTQLETSFLDDAFHFTAPELTGQVVVLISCSWTSYDDVSGTVSYAFCTAA